jgi:hypothetical protein
MQYEILTGDNVNFNGWNHTGDVRQSNKGGSAILDRAERKYADKAIAAVPIGQHKVEAYRHSQSTRLSANPWVV